MYELLPSVIFKASARLSFRVIKFFVVLPSKFTFSPVPSASDWITSASIVPTFVISPSPASNALTVSLPAESRVACSVNVPLREVENTIEES